MNIHRRNKRGREMQYKAESITYLLFLIVVTLYFSNLRKICLFKIMQRFLEQKTTKNVCRTIIYIAIHIYYIYIIYTYIRT